MGIIRETYKIPAMMSDEATTRLRETPIWTRNIMRPKKKRKTDSGRKRCISETKAIGGNVSDFSLLFSRR